MYSEPLERLCLIDHKPAVCAGADRFQVVLHFEIEAHLAALHRAHGRGDFDGHIGQGRRQMADRYFDADRILVGVGVLEDEIAAGMLDVAHHARRGVDAPLFAHKADGSFAIDRDPAGARRARTQAVFHGSSALFAGRY